MTASLAPLGYNEGVNLPDDRTEEDHERLNRQLGELLQELRVMMPGVQVLFAFLLAVPFATGFDTVNAFQKSVYLFTLLTATVSSALFIAPAAYHRILFERGEKERIIKYATIGAIAGLAFLALAMSGAVLLVTSYLFGDVTAGITTGGVVAVFFVMWFGIGLWRRQGTERVR